MSSYHTHFTRKLVGIRCAILFIPTQLTLKVMNIIEHGCTTFTFSSYNIIIHSNAIHSIKRSPQTYINKTFLANGSSFNNNINIHYHSLHYVFIIPYRQHLLVLVHTFLALHWCLHQYSHYLFRRDHLHLHVNFHLHA